MSGLIMSNKSFKTKLVRDSVTGYGKQIKKATNKHFGINNSLLVSALKGNEKALKKISDMGAAGERMLMAMPAIKEHLKNYIEGTKEYNQALAEIYKSGGKGAVAIDKAGGDLSLEDLRYNNQTEENKTRLFAQIEKEYQRHDDAMDVIELQAWIDKHLATVEARANLEAISNRPFIAQKKSDKDYEDKKIEHLLEYGSNSDLSLIPKKHYSTNPVVRFWNHVREMFS